ncbi:MAG: serine/threonine-protein phosphatase [Chloroflexi bacterium]|nr:serine/threonine-protein phosphatase [Chloroflexota bacterium]
MFGNPPTPLQLAAVALTHPGLVRKSNEDRVFEMVTNSSEREPIGVFAVCDGVGGHLAGEAASHLAVEAMRASLNVLFAPSDPRATLLLPETVVMQTGTSDPQPSSGTQITQKLVEAVQFANSVVHNYSRQKPAEAGNASATVTAALVRGRLAVGANVGDSRTYMLRGDELTQVSRDHSMVAYLVTLGQIKPEDVYTHPQRNQIYRSLGTHPDVEVDTWRFLLEPGDMLLLCSDGLWEMIHDPGEIASLMRSSPDLAEAGQRLIDAANRYGGEDNIGIVLARLEGN